MDGERAQWKILTDGECSDALDFDELEAVENSHKLLRQRLAEMEESCTELRHDREMFWKQCDERDKLIITMEAKLAEMEGQFREESMAHKLCADITVELQERVQALEGERDEWKRKYDLISDSAEYWLCCDERTKAEERADRLEKALKDIEYECMAMATKSTQGPEWKLRESIELEHVRSIRAGVIEDFSRWFYRRTCNKAQAALKEGA